MWFCRVELRLLSGAPATTARASNPVRVHSLVPDMIFATKAARLNPELQPSIPCVHAPCKRVQRT
jgi:hypothetical protein